MIYKTFKLLLEDKEEYEKMSKASNPNGDGYAYKRIANILEGKQYISWGEKQRINYQYSLNIYLKNFVIICLCFVIDSEKNLRYIVESTIKPLFAEGLIAFCL